MAINLDIWKNNVGQKFDSQFLTKFYYFSSCDFPGVLEEEICQSGSSLGLYGFPGRGGEAEVKSYSKVPPKLRTLSRPEFAANAPYLEKNPITGIKVRQNYCKKHFI